MAEKEGWPVDIKVGELPPSAGTGLRAVGLPGLGPVAVLTTGASYMYQALPEIVWVSFMAF